MIRRWFARRRAVPSVPRPAFSRVWLVGYAVLALFGALAAAGIVRLNTTPSLPRGVYLLVPAWGRAPSPGDDVFACMPPGRAARLALARGYVAPSRRDCPSGGVPLLKHVLAAEGDTVAVGPAGVVVRGRRVGLPAPVRDRLGRPLRPVSGVHVVGPGALWLGSDIANGYDSRYLGPVGQEHVLGRAYRVVGF